MSHTAELVFQMAFEEIYSSDASTWHLQFHGNANPTLACRDVDVFLSNGIEAAPPTLYELNANIAAASAAAAAGGPVLTVEVYDAPGDCILRGTDNMQTRFASGLPHARICAQGNLPIGPSRFIHVEQRHDAVPRPHRPFGHARTEPQRSCRRNFGDFSGFFSDSWVISRGKRVKVKRRRYTTDDQFKSAQQHERGKTGYVMARCCRDVGSSIKPAFSNPVGTCPRAPQAHEYVDLSDSHRRLELVPDGCTPTDCEARRLLKEAARRYDCIILHRGFGSMIRWQTRRQR